MKEKNKKIKDIPKKDESLLKKEESSVSEISEKEIEAKKACSKVLTKKEPEKSLTTPLKKKAGRNTRGVITVRHRGGGAKRLYRLVDFKREKHDVKAEVLALEYDPNRSSFIALIKYDDGKKSYILAPEKLKIGQKVISSANRVKPVPGNRMPLKHIPLGTTVSNIELTPGKGGQIVKAAGTYALILARDGQFTHLKMPSGEIRKIKETSMATVGQLSNAEHSNIVIGKAGRKRHMGVRPTVRGKAMNPVDHPHGGGEGRQPIGLKHPKTPWGAPALGYKTRKAKSSDKFIVKRRKRR